MINWNQKSGFSLLELLTVILIIGLISVVGVISVSDGMLGNISSDTYAHQLASDLQYVRRCAIATGNNHRIRFTTTGSDVTGYAFEEIDYDDSTVTEIDSARSFPNTIDVNVSGGAPTFDFQGQATIYPTISVSGPDHTWQINIIPVSGAIELTSI